MKHSSQAIKVLHVSNSMGIGGAERALYQLIKCQGSFDRLTPSLVVLSKPGLYCDKVEALGVGVHKLWPDQLGKVKALCALYRLFSKVDIVHFHSAHPLLMAISMLPMKTKFVYTHRAGAHIYPLKRKLVYKVTGIILRNGFSSISANTEFAGKVAQKLFKLGERIVFTTYNGIDFSLLKTDQPKEAVYNKFGLCSEHFCIGTTANLRALKRIDIIIRALSGLPENFVACIVGDGPDLQRLKSLACELGVEKRCIFVGKVKNVANYLQVMDCFILPSDSSESFGNSVVEAIGYKIPSIVMGDSGGTIEHMCYPSAMIARSDDDIVDFVQKLYNDSDFRARNAAEGAEYVIKKYTYANSVKQYLTLYTACGVR